MNTCIASKLDALRALCEKHGAQSLWVFGSATTDSFDETSSDLDFLVEFRPQPRHGLDDVYFELKDDLAALFGRSVDLVELKAITNPYFLREVQQHRVELYAA